MSARAGLALPRQQVGGANLCAHLLQATIAMPLRFSARVLGVALQTLGQSQRAMARFSRHVS